MTTTTKIQYTTGSGLPWSTIDFNRRTNDAFVLLVDGDTFGVTRLRDYGSGPGRYLWNAYRVDELPEGGWVIVDMFGSFHHAARTPNGSLAGAVYAMHQARVDQQVSDDNEAIDAEMRATA